MFGTTRSCFGKVSDCLVRSMLYALISLVLAGPLPSYAYAVEGGRADQLQGGQSTLDFSGYNGEPVEQWLRAKGFTFEQDAKKRDRLGISITDASLVFSANRPLSGFILNDLINVEKVGKVRLNWGIIRYPENVAYSRQINNEALMVYFFFGKEKISSGHVLIPNSPFFIGLFLCQDDRTNFPYKGR